MNDCPSFDEFYAAVHGREPFPWQRRLAQRVVESGWPTEIGVPTGLGKTSAIDIAVWGLAAQADLLPNERTAPTRIWYVVNRRLLVDAASEHAARLARLLASPTDDVLAATAARLRKVEGEVTGQPLRSSRMRGGSTLDSRPRHLGQPAVICATVPMYASRLLFRAYGSSNRVWAIDAALAGIDSLVLLDEAHLSGPLRDLVQALAESDVCRSGVLRAAGTFVPGAGPEQLVGRSRAYPQLVALTATGERSPDRFDLDEADLAHPVVQRRLSAAKRGEVRTTARAGLPGALAEAAVEHLVAIAAPTSVLVFANRPADARSAAAEVERQLRGPRMPEADVVVLTGQLRGADAEVVRTRLLDPVGGIPSGSAASLARSLVVVATQTLEVGADLDAAHLVTESAGVRALVQRIGRLNRLGERPQSAAVIVHPIDREGGLYGAEPAEVVARLTAADEPLDLSPRSIASVLGEPADTPERHAHLLPSHLWEWSKTSVRLADEAPIELFYEGFVEPERSVSVAWRRYLGVAGEPLYPAAHHLEWVEVPIYEARDFVARHSGQVWMLSPDGSTLMEADADDLRPGVRLIAHTSTGGYGSTGWDPSSSAEVADLSWRLCGALLLEDDVLDMVLGDHYDEALRAAVGLLRNDEVEVDMEAMAAEMLAVALSAKVESTEAPSLRPADVGIDWVGPANTPFLRWRVATNESPSSIDSLDELSLAPRAELDDHLSHVGELAERIASAVGLPAEVIAAVRQAGALHDLGKADPRFQRWLGALDTARPMAKSQIRPGRWQKQRIAAGWPRGARHELLSVQLLDTAAARGDLDLHDPLLVRHLVVAHHGHGRPSVDVSADGSEPIDTAVEVGGQRFGAVTDPGRVDWQQPERFRALSERYGVWGLSMLESIVRQADHIISEITEVQ